LIVSLGCETLQGRALLERLGSRGVLCDLVGIQDEGGSDAAVAAGIQACQSLPPLTQTRREATAPITVGVSYSGGNEDVASAYADALRRAGIQAAGPQDVSRSPVLATVELATEASALAIVHVGERSGSGPVLTPLISVASDEDAFRGAEDEFDVVEPDGEELVETVVRVVNGEPTVSERRGDAFFAIRRSLVTL
jgi:altronate dehydratase